VTGKRRYAWALQRDGEAVARGVLTRESPLKPDDEVRVEGEDCWVVSVGDRLPEILVDEYEDLLDGSALLRPVSERGTTYVYEIVSDAPGGDERSREFRTREPAWRQGDTFPFAHGVVEVLRVGPPTDSRYHARLMVRHRPW
jgi:hypothetical protein